jgi:Ca2+-binding EF-hand superfamily protein
LIETKEKLALEKKIKDDNKLALTDVSHDFTEEDFQSAFALLTEGAIRYFKGAPGSVPLNAFDVESLPPNIFKEQLKSVFNVKVTMPQLWALISFFDKDNTGSINCEKFLIQFFRTGYEERNRIKRGWQSEKLKKTEKKMKEREAKEEEKAKIAWQEVDFGFSEEEFDAALSKLIHMCYSFDSRQVGPAGLVAFEAKSLNPAEFREMLKRTFNVKLSPRELGAMVTYFDISQQKVVNCSFFLNSLVQIRVRCEEFKVSSDRLVAR